MKKSYIPISDVSNEKNELTRRIYRSLTEVVRQLDDVRGRSQTVSNLFLPCLATLKIKLHDLCYKLILTDPLGCGKKGEELLWRKGYHDMFTTAKRLRKNDTWSPEEIGYVQGLLISGIGHYQHLLLKLQTDYKFNFQGITDFPLSICDLGLPKGKTSQQKLPDKNLAEWAKESCHRCLIYLGDLNRYVLDIYPLWDSGTAERYYLQAANMNIHCGRPYNQLGTLAGSKNYNLDAVYNYVRCIIRSEPFQGSEGNLRKALDKNLEMIQLEPFLPNPAPGVQKLIMRFLFLFDIWYFEKMVDGDLHNSCHEMLQEFQISLREENTSFLLIDCNELEITNLTPFRDRSVVHPDRVDSDMVLKMVILVLLCLEKLQKKDSPQTSAVVAMCLAMFSQLLQQMIERFQQFYSRFGSPEVFSNDSQKSQSSSGDSQPRNIRNEKYKKKNKFERFENQANGNSSINKKNSKYSDKKRNKCNYKENEEANSGNVELSDVTIEETKKTVKKKNRLKRRKRVRPETSYESDLSDSDITLNDSSTDNESFPGDSESEEVISSGSEDLDETLLIIDQKLKEKKSKDEEKTNQTNGLTNPNNSAKEDANNMKEENSLKNLNDITVLEKEIKKNGTIDQNGLKLPNEKDKTKSLFTILNGVEEDVKLNENSRGDFTVDESTIGSDTANGNTLSESATNESSELGETVKDVDSNTTLFNLRQVDGKKFMQFLFQQGILKAVKVYCDWFLTDPETVKACSKSSKTLLGKLVTFLNLIAFEEELFSKEWSKVKDKSDNIPLSEDIVARGLTMLQGGHEKLDWEYHSTNRINNVEENLLRLWKITEFGHYLTKIEETGVLYNKQSNSFYLVGQNGKVPNMSLEMANKKHTSNASRKGQLMKNMGQLWLKAEVRDLESRVRRRAGNFSPYLVVDSEALIEHIVLVKQLVGSRQFIVIIPTVVLSHLDECKRDSGRARETIRWLESQFQHGNRSLRAQKSQERISLPLIKYPKKKDKEAWNFFQIVECCHYFSKQSEFQSCQSSLLVTLLTGQRDVSFVGDSKKDDFGKDYSPIGVAKNFVSDIDILPKMSRRRAHEDDDGYDRAYRKRRRVSENQEIEDRLESLILRVGEKSTSSLESNLEGLASVLEADLASFRNKILRILTDCAIKMPEKCTIYTTLVGLLNVKNYNFGGEFVEYLVRNFKESLKGCRWDSARYSLRFLADLVNCHVIAVGSLVQLLSNMVEASMEDGVPQVRKDWYVYAVLCTLPWIGRELYEKKEQALDNLLVNIQVFLGKRQKKHLRALRVWSTDNPHPQEEYLDCLWAQICKLRQDNWQEKHIPRPYLAFDSALSEALQHNLPNILPPPHHESYIYPMPSVVFRMFDYTDCPEGPILPGAHSIERFLIEEHLHQIIEMYHLERKECAAHLLNFPYKSKIPLDYCIVEVIFGEIFHMPNPRYLEICYGSILIELCKLQPSTMPQVLAQATEILFMRIDTMNTSCFDRLVSWFAYHLSNFQFRWSWEDWSECLSLESDHPKPKFIQEVLRKALRLSYFQRVKEMVTEPFESLLPPKPDICYKYASDEGGNLPGTSVANQLVAKIRAKCSPEEVIAVLKELPNPAMEDDSGESRFHPLKIDVFVQTLLYLGSKSFSHSFAAISKFHYIFKILAESEEAQICILRNLYEVWQQHPQMICVLVDKMLKTQIIECSAVANWIFSKEMSTEFTRMYLWEILHLTIKKMNKHVTRVSRELSDARERLGKGESDSESDNENKNNDEKEKPTEEMVDRMEERLEAAQADQKNLFLIIFQRFIMNLSEHLVRCDTDGKDFDTHWYRWTLGRLQQVFMMHHEQVQKYSATLETLLFTSDLDHHILDVFHQFLSLRS